MSDSVADSNHQLPAPSFDIVAARAVSKFMTSCILSYDRERKDQVIDRNLFIEEEDINPETPTIDNVKPYWDTTTSTVLDFGCGAGNISLYLKPYIHRAIGVDMSDSMIADYKERTGFDGFCCNIALDTTPGLDEVQFDAIVCTLTYHHVSDYNLVTQKLTDRLRPGGWLYVVDFDSTKKYGSLEHVLHVHGLGHHPDDRKRDELLYQIGTAHKYGFSPEIAIGTFENAGLTNIGVDSGLSVRAWPSLNELQYMSGQDNEDFSKLPRDSNGRIDLTFGLLLVAGQKPSQSETHT